MTAALIVAGLVAFLILLCAIAFARASALEEDAKDNEIDFSLEEWKWPHL